MQYYIYIINIIEINNYYILIELFHSGDLVRTRYVDLFIQATGFKPYPYQIELATSEHWPEVIEVETGVGKTAAIVTAWLFKRRFSTCEAKASTPRRLIICLPTRVLVEQTYLSAMSILRRLGIGSDFYDT